ncbi:hypothetical protein [Sphingobium sp. HDIP04]|uniref:hypothetical protein n=1 Tax=Sphingobium sp. HDIP04 TaxID=428994 RepID=UPI0003879A86|nr:hypothetical protein [Sphingobium sp. HDIP04]EQA97263.1 hypothetical protein L286_23340 [Sphingobium sp. HDIP04]
MKERPKFRTRIPTAEHFQQVARNMQDYIESRKGASTDPLADGYTHEEIACNRGPTYQFLGKLLGEHTTNPKRDRAKWTEIRLWETPSGKWVAESAGCSDEPGHVDIADAAVIAGDQDGRSMEFQAMDFWGWSSPAKALAKRLGWNLVVRVD